MIPKTFLFIGRSGAGKGTQAKLLAEHLRSRGENIPVYYLETGSHFREFIQGDSYSSGVAKDMYDRGERMPDFLAVWNWADLLVKNFTSAMHLIMDGMPRSLSEAEMLRTAFNFYKITDVTIIYLDVTQDWSRKRLLERHRLDDNPAEIEKKISWFNNDVMPAIEYFKSDRYYHYLEVNGEGSIEDVQKEIISKIRW